MNIGIDLISFYTPSYCFDLSELALRRNIEADYFRKSIGQCQMSVSPPDEDIVTLGANAAYNITQKIFKGQIKGQIKALIVATETGVDQSKAAGIFIHNLLGLHEECRVIEMKQACYSATYALQSAMGLIALNPDDKVLIISSDIAKYDLQSPGEATQGAGAVAMLISANPRLICFDKHPVFTTGHVMDFWRPNYRKTAVVDGLFSTKVYLKSLRQCWKMYMEKNQAEPHQINHLCFHLPFTRIAEKALAQLFKCKDELATRLSLILPTLVYNKTVGNSYAASLYMSLCSLFDNSTDNLAKKRIGFFSYGSGFVAEFFSGVVLDDYAKHLFNQKHQNIINNRRTIGYQQYLDFYHFQLPEDGSFFSVPEFTKGYFRLAGIDKHCRLYEFNSA